MKVDKEDKQVVAHLYRGEMNRMTVYRQRLDTTTNWAITLESAILVIYLDKKLEFYFILFPLAILLFLSFLEARRYRYFYTSAKRVQFLETGYFAQQIFQQELDLENPLDALIENVSHVQFLIGLRQAWIIRFYRNYIWLYYISLVIMTYKYTTIPTKTLWHLVSAILLYFSCLVLHVTLHVHYCLYHFIDL